MLVIQKNQLFAIVKGVGLDSAAFAWKKIEEEWSKGKSLGGYATLGHIQNLLHIPTGYFFDFYFVKECGFYGKFEFSPGVNFQTITISDTNNSELNTPSLRYNNPLKRWEQALNLFKQWTQQLKAELEGDLWVASSNTIQNASVFFEEPASNFFAANELQKLKETVAEFKHLVIAEVSSHHTSEQLEIINARLDYLVESAERLGKKDWQLLAIGLITNIVSSLIVSPESMNALLVGANVLFGWAFAGASVQALK